MEGTESFEASAEAYDRHLGRYGPTLSVALVEFAGVGHGTRALDVGCGPGALTSVLVQSLGSAHVCAVDQEPQFVAACRERCPSTHVVRASAAKLPFIDHTFDVTLAQLVINFLPNALAGVREMARVTRPRGRVAACVWDYSGQMTLLRTFWDAAREVDPSGAGEADEGRAMPWCEPDELSELWQTAGLQSVRSAALQATASYEGFDDLWAPFLSGAGRSGAYCRALTGSQRAELRGEFQRRLGRGDAPFALTARAWAVAGTV